ncbi:MAG: hypothetical protein AB7O04_12805 [Hyphomonadaceae bacterium]
MTPDEYRAALDRLGLSQVGAADILGISSRTAQRFAVDGPSGPAARLFMVLLALPKADREKWIDRLRTMPRD